jgi:hypothetical protein
LGKNTNNSRSIGVGIRNRFRGRRGRATDDDAATATAKEDDLRITKDAKATSGAAVGATAGWNVTAKILGGSEKSQQQTTKRVEKKVIGFEKKGELTREDTDCEKIREAGFNRPG